MPPPGLEPAPTRRNHVSGSKDTAADAAHGPPGNDERPPWQGTESSSIVQGHVQDTTDSRQTAARRTEPLNVWATVYRVVGTRGRSRTVIVVCCPWCQRFHVHSGRPDFISGKRTASCHEGRYVVHVGTLEGQVAA